MINIKLENKLLVLLFLFFGFSLKLFSQDCQPSYEKGSVINKGESRQGYFCFKKDPEPLIDSIPGMYHTKYTISFGKGRETYNIHFYFYKLLDSISIKYMNTVSGKMTTEEIAFKKHSSIRMFKNYKANDTTINANDIYYTLFTIPDTLRPYVSLNQFQLPDNSNICLKFTEIDPEKLQQHDAETRNYFRLEDSISIVKKTDAENRLRHKNTIDSIFRSMNDYKDYAIKKIIDEDSVFKLKGPVAEAPLDLLEEFRTKVDPLFREYLKNNCPFENYDSEIRFTFISNGNGKININKTQIESINSLRIKWIEDNFKMSIQSHIEEGIYRTVNTVRTNTGIIAEFNNIYVEAINYLKANSGNEEYKEFLVFKNKIYSELEKYILDRDINTPTKYTYSIKYRSTVSIEDWIYEINKKGVEKIGPKKAVEATSDELKILFKKNIAKPGIGKYHIKICNAFLNNNLISLDISPAEIEK